MLLSIFLIIAILVDVKWCPMVVLICISLMTSFYMLIACLYIFFGKIFIQILCSLKIQLCFNCYSIQVLLYILDSKCLSDKCFWKNFIFFPFCGLFVFFFAFLMMSFETKIFSLLKSNLYIFFFCYHAFSIVSKKPLSNPKSWRFTPKFSSKIFILYI